MSKFLLAGLGNIGIEYAGTRHNIGFDVVNELARKHGAAWRSDRYADIAEVKWKGRGLIIVKPTTYMNLGGKAIRYWTAKENIPLERLLVVVDEIALPLNRIRIRPSGSDGGHNGLKSIAESLQTDQYPRLRFGIGNDFPKGRQVEYVLGKWLPDEIPLINFKVQKCAEILESFVVMGIERTMNEANKMTFSL